MFSINDGSLTSIRESAELTFQDNLRIVRSLNIFAPVSKGQKIGEVNFKDENNNVIGTVDLVASQNVEKYGFTSMSENLFKKWFSVLRK